MKFIISPALFIFLFCYVHGEQSMPDTPFVQEYHEAYPLPATSGEKEVKSIAADHNSTIWIATAAGVFMKKKNDSAWSSPFTNDADKGPAYSVAVVMHPPEGMGPPKKGKGYPAGDEGVSGFSLLTRGVVWMGTWKGVYVFENNVLKYIHGTEGPVSAVCVAKEGIYALGPAGAWLYNGKEFIKKEYLIARSVRDVISDGSGGIWVATDVGLYHCNAQGTKHIYNTDVLLSAYVKGIALDNTGKLWTAGLGGVTILEGQKKQGTVTSKEGCPSVYVTCVQRSPQGIMWIGTQAGVLRYLPDGSHSLLFSRRWLADDMVNDIDFDIEGNAWIATAKGVSAIKKRQMTLAEKEQYFYDVLMKRHIRKPWIAGQCHLAIEGDVNSWQPEDDDNDGEYTGNYLAMESFRYAVTKSTDAREKAHRAFNFLKQLQEVTGSGGFFARTIVPVEWGNNIHDANQTFTGKQKADELVKEPRFKPVEIRWRKSVDAKWLWKGDASSDEMCGHMMGYYFYYELAADEGEKNIIRKHVMSIVDHLIANNFNMMDIDGIHTRWAVWSPDLLNRDPEWMPDRNQNSMELLAFLKLAYHLTGDIKYQQHYLHLIKDEHYLDNMAGIPSQNPAWFIYFDVMLQAYVYPILLKCETDPKLLAFYRLHMDNWMEQRRDDKNPVINFLYCYARNKNTELTSSVEFLKDTPLDLIDWTIDHTKREDVKIVRMPVPDELQVDQLPPASIRSVVRWDKNPWTAINGYPNMEREPVFWQLPYWMGRYLKMIE